MKNKYEKEITKHLIDPLVTAVEQEKGPSEFESAKHYHKRLKKQVIQSLHGFQERTQAGVAILEEQKKWPHDDRLETMTALLHDQRKLAEQMNQGKTLQQVLEFSDQELADFYTVGLENYQHGQYHNAGSIFMLLTQLNPYVGSFWLALGGAEEMDHDIQGAAYAYIFGSELEMQTLAPYLRGAQCLLQLNKVEEAKKLLHRAIARAGEEIALKGEQHLAKQMLKSMA